MILKFNEYANVIYKKDEVNNRHVDISEEKYKYAIDLLYKLNTNKKSFIIKYLGDTINIVVNKKRHTLDKRVYHICEFIISEMEDDYYVMDVITKTIKYDKKENIKKESEPIVKTYYIDGTFEELIDDIIVFFKSREIKFDDKSI